MASRWLAFDPALDVEVTIGDETREIANVVGVAIPEVTAGIPGTKAKAEAAAQVAVDIVNLSR